MSIWVLMAMGAAAVLAGALMPGTALQRLHRRADPGTAPGPTPRARAPWVVAGAAAALVVGWLLLPADGLWALPLVLVPGAIAGERVGRRIPDADLRRQQRRRSAELPAILDLLATCLAAGLPLRSAAAAVRDTADGPVRDDLSRVLHRLELGVPDRDAWLVLAENPLWRGIARDLARSVASGTGLVEVLHQAAEDTRRAHHADQLERARTVGVRSVWPLMVCYLPAFLLVGIVPIIGSAVLRLLG